MDASAIEGAGRGRATATARTVAYLGAASFVAAGLLYGLAAAGVTVDSEPSFFEARLVVYYRWFESTLQQERLYASIAILGFLCLPAAAPLLRSQLDRLDARVDKVNDAFQLGALALVGVGMVVLAVAVRRAGSAGRSWTWLTLAAGLVSLATGGAYAAAAFNFDDLLLVLGGVVALPVWLAATARLLTDGGVAA